MIVRLLESLLVIAVFVVAGCASSLVSTPGADTTTTIAHPAKSIDLTVFAAASLTDAFGEIGRGEQLAVSHATQRPVPLAHRLGPHVVAEEGQGAADRRVVTGCALLLASRRAGLGRRRFFLRSFRLLVPNSVVRGPGRQAFCRSLVRSRRNRLHASRRPGARHRARRRLPGHFLRHWKGILEIPWSAPHAPRPRPARRYPPIGALIRPQVPSISTHLAGAAA